MRSTVIKTFIKKFIRLKNTLKAQTNHFQGLDWLFFIYILPKDISFKVW